MSDGRLVAITSREAALSDGIAAAFVAAGDRVVVAGEVGDGASLLGSIPAGPGSAALLDALDRLVTVHGDPEVLVTVPAFGESPAGDGPSFTAELDEQVTGAWLAARRVLPVMAERRHGRIVMVSGVGGLAGSAWGAAQSAGLAGLIGLARSLVRELADSAITVNVVAPGVVDCGGPVPAGLVERSAIPRPGTPADVAAAVEWLASDGASYVTGVVLPVDGGLAMGFG